MLRSISRATSLHLGELKALKRIHGVVRHSSTFPSVSDLAKMAPTEAEKVMNTRGDSGMTLEWTKGLGSHMMTLKPVPKPIIMHVLKRAKLLFEQQDNVLDIHCCGERKTSRKS